MDKLKQFIDNNREAFDNVELPEGHLERFEKKLSTRGKRRTLWYSLYGAAAAACIALMIIFRPATDHFTEEDEAANACEIEELQLYYSMQINDVLAKIEAVYEKDASPKSTQLMQATKQVLDDSGHFEEEILPTIPCSEEGIYAINQHYRNSLTGLQIMLDQMENDTDTH
ncbi:hypothetical protein LJC44_00755 [Parabacteroides sp. OttesenSCG-928-G06]|nr:hypothetical protein [Parabacteroides sp. OttesenSCG-928-G06]